MTKNSQHQASFKIKTWNLHWWFLLTVFMTATTAVCAEHPNNGFAVFPPSKLGYLSSPSFNPRLGLEFTIELWIKGEYTSSFTTLISYATTVNDNSLILAIWGRADLMLSDGDTGGTNMFSTVDAGSLLDGCWHHLAVTRAMGTISWFVDGTLADSFDMEQRYGIPRNVSPPDGGCLVFGQEQDSLCGGFTTSQALVGKLADIRIWETVRTAAEISSSRDQLNLAATGPELVALWPLDCANNFTDVVGGGQLSAAGEARLNGCACVDRSSLSAANPVGSFDNITSPSAMFPPSKLGYLSSPSFNPRLGLEFTIELWIKGEYTSSFTTLISYATTVNHCYSLTPSVTPL